MLHLSLQFPLHNIEDGKLCFVVSDSIFFYTVLYHIPISGKSAPHIFDEYSVYTWTGISQLPTHHCCFCSAPKVVTHSSPHSVIAQFHKAFQRAAASCQSQVSIAAIYRNVTVINLLIITKWSSTQSLHGKFPIMLKYDQSGFWLPSMLLRLSTTDVHLLVRAWHLTPTSLLWLQYLFVPFRQSISLVSVPAHCV